MSELTVDDVPEVFADSATLPPTIVDEMIEEVKGQLLRKYMGMFGSSLSMANGTDLYAVSVDGFKNVYAMNRTVGNKKIPSHKKSEKCKTLHGSQAEVLSTTGHNRASVINGDGFITQTTDDLGRQKKREQEIPSIVANDAKVHNPTTDIVRYNESTGKVERIQYKNVRNIANMLKDPSYIEGYTDNNGKFYPPPDFIHVPMGNKPGEYDAHKKKLEDLRDNARTPEEKIKIQAYLDKLRADPPGVTRADSGSPNWALVKQTTSDAVLRTSENVLKGIMPELAALSISGVIYEIKDANINPDSIRIWERLKRFLSILLRKVADALQLRAGKEFLLEIVNGVLGILKSTFKSFGAFISTVGKSINTVWESIYNYITGKIQSFSELVGIILKSIATISIGALGFSLERFFESIGIPSIIGGFIAAAFSGVAIVFANRGIDSSLRAMLSILSAAQAAKMRREEIESFCAQALPQLIDDRVKLQAFTDKYYKERTLQFDHSFADMHNAINQDDSDSLLKSMHSINEAFGTQLGWTSVAEFDEIMLDDQKTFVL